MSEKTPKEKPFVDTLAVRHFAQTAVSLYREETTWEYLANRGLSTPQMLLADFDTDSKWQQAIAALPTRFRQQASALHEAVIAARPLKRALVDESVLETLQTSLQTNEPAIRISAYQQVELTAWEPLRLRGAQSSYLLTDVLLHTNPGYISNVQGQRKAIQGAAHLLLQSLSKAVKIPLTTELFPAERIVEGLLTSNVLLSPPRKHARPPSLTASRR